MEEWLVNAEDLPKGILEFHKLLCGCGSPGMCWDSLIWYLEICTSKENYFNTENSFELFFMYVISHLGLTEHGTSIYGSWITEKGKECLNWLHRNTYKLDNMVVCY